MPDGGLHRPPGRRPASAKCHLHEYWPKFPVAGVAVDSKSTINATAASKISALDLRGQSLVRHHRRFTQSPGVLISGLSEALRGFRFFQVKGRLEGESKAMSNL